MGGQIGEALQIENRDYDNILNSKAEWSRNRIPRQMTVVQDEIWEDKYHPKQDASPQESP